MSCFESFWWFLNVILNCSGFSAASAYIKLAAIINTQTLWLFSSRREPPFVINVCEIPYVTFFLLNCFSLFLIVFLCFWLVFIVLHFLRSRRWWGRNRGTGHRPLQSIHSKLWISMNNLPSWKTNTRELCLFKIYPNRLRVIAGTKKEVIRSQKALLKISVT